jgi:hypothetical protein
MWSAVAAERLGIIGRAELARRLERTISTLEGMEQIRRTIRPIIGVEEFAVEPRGCNDHGRSGPRPAARHARRRRDLRAGRR